MVILFLETGLEKLFKMKKVHTLDPVGSGLGVQSHGNAGGTGGCPARIFLLLPPLGQNPLLYNARVLREC